MAEPNTLIGNRYRLIRQLGSGGMSVVWEARDERLNRRVAVKQLRVEPGLSEEDARTASDRAMREARINARLQHPHAVAIFDVVEHEGRPCLVMELVSGRTVADAQRESTSGRLPLAQVCDVASQVAAALAAAHALGIVHRDVKPSNILIDADGRARITDFGISRAAGDGTLTLTGMISGTPAYLAPEVARGQQATAASDVFSLGATLYAAVEGKPPFGNDANAMALLYRVAEGHVPTPTRAGDLAPLLNRMLASDPGARPEMAEVAITVTGMGNLDSELLHSGDDTSTVAVPPPTGARPAIDVAAGAAASGAGGDRGASPEEVPAPATTLAADTRPRGTPPVGDPPPPSHPSWRRALTAAAVALVIVAAAVVLAAVLWQRAPLPDANPDATAAPSASEQASSAAADEDTQTQAGKKSSGTKATSRTTEPAADGRQTEPSQKGEPSQETETAPSADATAPSETPPGQGDGGNQGDAGGGSGQGKGNGDKGKSNKGNADKGKGGEATGKGSGNNGNGH